MGLDIHKGHKNPHFNLYGKKDDKLILFTRDHILPKSKGGEDSQKNYQTMCEVCNMKKRNRDITVEQLQQEILGKQS
jgi:5-methylcytosine-specific restriction endonuclease McrA